MRERGSHSLIGRRRIRNRTILVLGAEHAKIPRMELNEGETKAAAATAKQNFFREETKVEGRKMGA